MDRVRAALPRDPAEMFDRLRDQVVDIEAHTAGVVLEEADLLWQAYAALLRKNLPKGKFGEIDFAAAYDHPHSKRAAYREEVESVIQEIVMDAYYSYLESLGAPNEDDETTLEFDLTHIKGLMCYIINNSAQ